MKPTLDPTPVVVINLDRCPDRYDTFRYRNAHLGQVRRLSAVEGAVVDRLDLQRRGVIEEGLNYSDGALGCALSHFTLWEEVASGARALTVCEDDAVFAPDFPAASEACLAGLPDDWDIVLWGWQFDSMMVFQVIPGQPSFLCHMPPSPRVDDFLAGSAGSTAPRLFRLNRACGTLCYTISPHGATRFLALCRPLRQLELQVPEQSMTWPNVGIDVLMSMFYQSINAYVSLPPLTMSPNTSSTTRLTVASDLLDRAAALPFEALVGEVAAMDATAGIEAEIYRAWILANPNARSLDAAWFNLASAFARAGDHNHAMIAYHNVLLLNREFNPAATALNLMLRRSGLRV